MDRPHHRSDRHRHRATGEGPARDAVPGHRRAEDGRCRAVDHALVPGAAGVSDVAARPRRPPDPRRLPAAGAAAAPDVGRRRDSNSSNRCASATKSTRTSRISDVTMKTGSHRRAVLRLRRAHRSRRRAASRSASGRTSSIATWAARPPAAPAKAPPPPPVAKHRESHCQRSRAAVSLFGADLQRPPHPLRPRLRHQGRGLSGPDLPRPAAGGADRRIRRKASRRHARRRNSAIAACSRCSKAASSRSTPTRPAPAWNCGSRTPRASRP